MTESPRTLWPWTALAAAVIAAGIAYPVAKATFESIPPLAFVSWRFAIAAVGLLVLSFPTQSRVWRDGAIAGLWLFGGYTLQAVGLERTTTANTALLSGLHVVLAPLALVAMRRSRLSPWVIVALVLGFVGVILLTLDDTFGPGEGDLIVLAAAVAFAGNVAALASSASRHLLVPLTAVQLLVTAILASAASLVLEGPTLPTGPELPAVVVSGLGLTAAAYLLQVWAQTRLGPERAAAGLALVPLAGLAAAVAFSGDRLPVQGWLGGAAIVGSVTMVMMRNHDLDAITAESVGAGH